METMRMDKKHWEKPDIIEISIKNNTSGGAKNKIATENAANKTYS